MARILPKCRNVRFYSNCWDLTGPLRSWVSARLVWQRQREQAALRSHIPEYQSGDVTFPVPTELTDPAQHSLTLRSGLGLHKPFLVIISSKLIKIPGF